MRLHWLSCMKQTLVMTDLQLCEHSVSSLREKRASEWIQQQFERQCKQGFLDFLCCVWFVSSVLRPFRRPWSCYVFIYLFICFWPLTHGLLAPSSVLSSALQMPPHRWTTCTTLGWILFIWLGHTVYRNASKQFQGRVNLLDLQSGLDFTFYQHLSVYIYLPLLLTGLNLKFQGPQNSLGEGGWFICILFYCWV